MGFDRSATDIEGTWGLSQGSGPSGARAGAFMVARLYQKACRIATGYEVGQGKKTAWERRCPHRTSVRLGDDHPSPQPDPPPHAPQRVHGNHWRNEAGAPERT